MRQHEGRKGSLEWQHITQVSWLTTYGWPCDFCFN
jgi:hypothetical protein